MLGHEKYGRLEKKNTNIFARAKFNYRNFNGFILDNGKKSIYKKRFVV